MDFVRCRHAHRQFPCLLGKDRKLKKSFGCLLENAGHIPLVVVIMTTANGMHPAFSGRRPKLFFFKFPIFTDLYRSLTEIAEVHNTPVTLSRVQWKQFYYVAAKVIQISLGKQCSTCTSLDSDFCGIQPRSQVLNKSHNIDHFWTMQGDVVLAL